VQKYLSERDMTAVDLQSRVIQQYNYVRDDPVASHTEKNPETDETELHPWKKAKHELLLKHVQSTPTRFQEIQPFRCLSVSPDNILSWWESQSTADIHVSHTVEAGKGGACNTSNYSAPSERIFSLAGLTINARRSSLASSAVDKVVFVHENVSLM